VKEEKKGGWGDPRRSVVGRGIQATRDLWCEGRGKKEKEKRKEKELEGR